MSITNCGGPMPWLVLPAAETAEWDGMQEWCLANIGPRVSPRGFLWLEPRRWGTGTGWRFRHRDDAVLFDMVWG